MKESLVIQNAKFYMEKEEKELLQSCIAMASMLEIPLHLQMFTHHTNNDNCGIELNFRIERIIGMYIALGPCLQVQFKYLKEEGYEIVGDVTGFKLLGSKLRASDKVLKLLRSKINEEVLRSGKE